MDKKVLLEKLARESFEKEGFNGAWIYAEKGEIVSKGACGWRDPEGTLPITEETIFQLASVSKTFTAAAVMLVVRQGLMSLDDKLVKFFPELADYEGVTVRHLLNHTGGIPDYFDDADWFVNVMKEEKRVPGTDDIIRFLKETKLKPLFVPGERFEYSNTGYNLLALIVERLTGVPYEEFLRKNIFEPAGMTSTRCCHVRRDGVPFENYARPIVLFGDKYVADIDSNWKDEVCALDGLNGDDYVYSNIFDMLAWDRALREGKILTLKEQELMYTPGKLNNGKDALYDDEDNGSYGFGWGIERDEKFGLVVSHSGGMPGVITWFERFVDADRVLVFLMNRYSADYRAIMGFYDGAQKIARDEEAEPVITIEEIAIKDPEKSKWESFCGKYEEPEDEEFIIKEVFMKDGDLYADAVSDDFGEITFRFYPLAGNKFGRKGGMAEIEFGEGTITYDGNTLKKLS